MLVDSYIAEVTVSVKLKSTAVGTVAEYSVIRVAKGPSSSTHDQPGAAKGALNVTEAALIDAIAAHHSLQYGVQNAENRRLK
jgi:hypothetical protein